MNGEGGGGGVRGRGGKSVTSGRWVVSYWFSCLSSPTVNCS